VSDPPYEYDVQERSPKTEKAADLLGFRATTSLSTTLDEVIPWITDQIKVGQI
jgi:UDP-glucose 4-epimerase